MKKIIMTIAAAGALVLAGCGRIEQASSQPAEKKTQTSTASAADNSTAEASTASTQASSEVSEGAADTYAPTGEYTVEIPSGSENSASVTAPESPTEIASDPKKPESTSEAPTKPSDVSVGKISQADDLALRTAFAAYAESHGLTFGNKAAADDIFGRYYIGTYNGYIAAVLNYGESYTDNIKCYKIRWTDADLKDPTLDLYPYIDIEVPSGSFELVLFKDGVVTQIEEAVKNNYISYDELTDIADKLNAHYTYGSGVDCTYTVE